ncbi:MAG: GNAT family N-acetyltransferase [Acidimicrobiales bacterium]
MSNERGARIPTTQIPDFREASARDVEAIASLHADSWQRHYRGAYLDSFLDGDVVADRQAVWTERLTQPGEGQFTIVAELDGVVVGFVHMILDADPTWGTLLDNLHVTNDLKRHGIGTRLLVESARGLVKRQPAGGFYLWVLDQNKAAQSFYAARGGARVETMVRGPFPGGGNALGHRIAWSDPTHGHMVPRGD